MIKKFLAVAPIVCFTASLVWAEPDATGDQSDPSPAPGATVEPAVESQSNFPLIPVTEPVSGSGHRQASWDDGLAYDSTGIDQTVRWVGTQGNHWAVRIDDAIAVRNLRIATPQETAVASLSDDQVNDRLGIEIGAWQ